jgi:epidermal growth factor receptor substrate 15
VQFFIDSGLPEDVLAGIWDLADINSEGQLNRDEFAVAMYLIRQQRKPGTPLPAALPPNLIPPSMRNQIQPQATVPPQPAPFAAPQPKSAAEDLFGLDAFSAPAPAAPQVQQSTGGSASFSKPFDNDPFASKTGSPTSPHPFQPAPRNPASTFKPFLPTSSFGQTLTSHSTGQSGTSVTQSRSNQPSAVDDLLGESDPDLNKKLTQDSTELANMSNQMSTLRTQMQEVQNKKVTTDQDVNSIAAQKRDLEVRLSAFKTRYEQEIKSVKALEDRLAASRTETRKLQQDLAVLEAQLLDVQGQHRQVGSALEADQRENADLKERIRQVNAEIAHLRPQLDKLRSDARQQKGMVAINKKQLATNEGERDKIRNEMSELSKNAEEGYRSPQGQAAGVASPAPSTASQNTNPFFRRSPQPSTDNTMSPSGFSQGPHKDFDNVFGNSFNTPQSTGPGTSFRNENQSHVPTFSAPSGQSVRSSEGPDVPTPSTSPPLSSYQESPRMVDPPAPPESRQFASSFLPLRDAGPRSDSFSSSVKVSAPASRYGGPGNETPTISKASPAATPVPEKPSVERSDTTKTESDTFGSSLFDRTASPVASITSDTQRSGSKTEERKDVYSNLGGATADIPGAFPETPLQQMPTGESSMSNQSKPNNRPAEGSQNRADSYISAGREQQRGSSSGKVDFDAAFAGFGSSRQAPDANAGGSGNNGTSTKFNKEFPPIEDLAHDDDSDSNSERGFADNFTSASPQQRRSSNQQPQQQQQQQQQRTSTSTATGGEGSTEEYFKPPPPTTRLDSNLSGLPTPNAQKSPPSYDQTMGPNRGGSNQFPPEFGGLLPSRTAPTSSPHSVPAAPHSPERTFSTTSAGGQGAALFGGSAKPSTTSPPPADTPSSTVPSDAYHSAVSYGANETKGPSPSTNAPQTSRSAFNDDFDAGFDDLTDAKEADDKGDDDFMMSSQHREGFDEFNPVFDSPAASKSNTMASQQTPTGKPFGDDSFGDFDHFGQSKAHQQDRDRCKYLSLSSSRLVSLLTISSTSCILTTARLGRDLLQPRSPQRQERAEFR